MLALNLREGEKWLQGTIVQKLGINVYGIHVDSLNIVWKRHANQMLRCYSLDMPQESVELRSDINVSDYVNSCPLTEPNNSVDIPAIELNNNKVRRFVTPNRTLGP